MGEIEVIGFGALNVDRIYGVESILIDGESKADDFHIAPGGSAANTICSLAKLGVRTGFIGAVGNDAEGKFLLQELGKEGIDTGQIKAKNTSTGSALCLTDSQGRRSIYILPGANDLLAYDDIDRDYVAGAKLLHLSSFVSEKQFGIKKRIVEELPKEVKVSFAPGEIYASKGLNALSEILRRTNVLLLNRKEIKLLTGEDFYNGASRCLEAGCGSVAVTFGKGLDSSRERFPVPIISGPKLESDVHTSELKTDRGNSRLACYIADHKHQFLVEAKLIGEGNRIEATGAGDAFAAGFLLGWLNGKELPQCAIMGDIVAQLSLTKVGARLGLPTLSELSHKYRELYGQPL